MRRRKAPVFTGTQRPMLRKGDMVHVVAGKDKGKSGKILSVSPTTGRAMVEKINYVKRHTRPRRQGEQGGILEKEAPIDLSNLMYECPRCHKPARLGIQALPDGLKQRVCRKCNEVVDK